ncbi:MAG: hypothetical protein ACI4WR_05765, partial [Bulleidia sp.]
SESRTENGKEHRMLSDIEPYLEFERRILYRAGVIRRTSMRQSLCRTFDGMDGHYADMMIEALQYHGGVLISEDGWLITKGCYKRITGDREFSQLRTGVKERIPAGVLEISDERDRAIADCMVVAADMMPFSRDFEISAGHWYIQFITPPKGSHPSLLFQITKIPKGEEFTMIQLLKNIPCAEKEETASHIRRIAVIEDPRCASEIPYIGFRYLCILNESSANGYRIVEKRNEEEMWKDYGF